MKDFSEGAYLAYDLNLFGSLLLLALRSNPQHFLFEIVQWN